MYFWKTKEIDPGKQIKTLYVGPKRYGTQYVKDLIDENERLKVENKRLKDEIEELIRGD